MRIPDEIMDHADTITSVASILGSLATAYVAKITGLENDPLVMVQKISLAILSVALFANGVYVFPEWTLINGHRPTGLIVESSVALTMIVLAARGYIRHYKSHH